MKLLLIVFLLFTTAVFGQEKCDPIQDLAEPVINMGGECDLYPTVCCNLTVLKVIPFPKSNDTELIPGAKVCDFGATEACLEKLPFLRCVWCNPEAEIENSRYIICPSFADDLYEACKGVKYGGQEPNCKIFTRELFDQTFYPDGIIKDHPNCYNGNNTVKQEVTPSTDSKSKSTFLIVPSFLILCILRFII